jgi:hypothetical protein
MSGAYSRHRRNKKILSILVRKPEQKRPVEKPRRVWEDNIKNVHEEIV